MSSFHGPKVVLCVSAIYVLCVSAIYAFTDSDININYKTQKFLLEKAKATGWTILGSTTGRGKIVQT